MNWCAVVGPLTKEQYVYALNGFKIHEAFPDVDTKVFGFSIDPQVSSTRPPPMRSHMKCCRGGNVAPRIEGGKAGPAQQGLTGPRLLA